jgi:hypothetical protein
MDKTKNRYIIAMEIGLDNEAEGITYHQLVDELEKHRGISLTKYAECTFMQWFLENYSTPSKPSDANSEKRYKYCIYFVKKKHGKEYAEKTNQSIKEYENKILNVKCFINGDASKKYVDYLELVESRESSKQAIKKANDSIWLAIAAMVISIGFSIYNLNTQTEPPYKVEVINQPPQPNQKLIDSLKDELYKADRLISIYEGDSINPYGKVIKSEKK